MSILDVYAAMTCGQCGEKISEADENADAYETREDGNVALHRGECAVKWDAEHRSLAARVPHMLLNIRTQACDYCNRLVLDCHCPRNVTCEFCECEPEDADEICVHSPDGAHLWKGDVGDGRETIQEVAA